MRAGPAHRAFVGMTLIDTAEVYSNGHSEELIGHVIAGQRGVGQFVWLWPLLGQPTTTQFTSLRATDRRSLK